MIKQELEGSSQKNYYGMLAIDVFIFDFFYLANFIIHKIIITKLYYRLLLVGSECEHVVKISDYFYDFICLILFGTENVYTSGSRLI